MEISMKRITLKTLKTALFAMAVLVVLAISTTKLFAATANVVVSSATVEEGQEVEISVTISSSDKMAAYNVMLKYDTTMLEYVSGADGGGNGAVQLLNEIFEDTSVTRTLKFTAKKAGSATVSVDTASSSAIDMNIEDCELAATNGTVTINAHVEASNNNNLSKLVVAGVKADGSTVAYNITQRSSGATGFNKAELEYRAYVANNIVKFAVTAVAEDANATVAIAGVDLEEGGSNETTITVTAQNGEKKIYTIYTYRKEAETETSTEEPSSSETPSEEPTTNNTENVDKTVVIGNDTFIITDITDDVIIPEGFSTSEYTYDGQVYIVAKGEAKKLTVMQLVNEATSDKALYVYDEVNNVFYKFVNIQVINKMYTVIEKPENVSIPAGYAQTLVNVDGEMLNIWVHSTIDGIYMFYGMNWNGETSLYLYDTVEKTVMRYMDGAYIEAIGGVTPQPSEKATTANNNSSDKDGEFTKNIIMFVEFAIILILIISIIIIILKKKEMDEEEAFDEYEEKTEVVSKVENVEESEELEEELEEETEIESEEVLEKLDEKSEIYVDDLEENVETEEIIELEEHTDLEIGLMGDIEDILESEPETSETEEEPEVEEQLDTVEEPEVEEEPETVEEPEVKEEAETVEEPEVEEEPETVEEKDEEEVLAEAVASQVEEPEVELTVEDMLRDSSTSLNEDELDYVLDMMLGEE